jgi:hypothetical protein
VHFVGSYYIGVSETISVYPNQAAQHHYSEHYSINKSFPVTFMKTQRGDGMLGFGPSLDVRHN